MSTRRLVTFFAALVALGSCVRVTTSYRDVGVDSPSIDAPTIDAPRPDAPPIDAPIDAARADTPPMDAPLPDTPIGDGADHVEVMADDEEGKAVVGAKPVEQHEHFAPY